MSPVLAHRLLSSLSNKLKLFFSHSITPCINIAIKKLQRIFQVLAECGKKSQAANIGLCPGIETLRPFSYSSVGKLSKF